MFETRRFRSEDSAPLCALINDIIAVGGTTSHETPFDAPRLIAHFFEGPDVLAAHVVTAEGVPLGFQTLARHDALPQGWGDIGTFTRRSAPVRGAGRALFTSTRAQARALGLIAINATIRADNEGGLRFYRGLGFTQYGQSQGVPLSEGRAVDRLHHRYQIGTA